MANMASQFDFVRGDWDVAGWDLRKALKLFYKSNPPLLEWLGSPIIYHESTSIPQKMRDLLADRSFSGEQRAAGTQYETNGGPQARALSKRAQRGQPHSQP